MYASTSDQFIENSNLIQAPKRENLSKTARDILYVNQGGTFGKWDGDIVPYMWEPMDCLQLRAYSAVIFVGPARTSKTVSLVDGWAMHTIANDPADMLIVQTSQEKASEFSKKRLTPAIHACPETSAALSPRSYDNNVHDKILKAGNYLKIGWPSKNVFASSDWKRVLLTDYDRMPQNVGGEGSPFMLAGKRTQTFMSSGMVLAESSPGFEITDPNFRLEHNHEAPPTEGILHLYNLGDRRLFYWQCTDCREWFEPDFDLLVWDKEEPDPSKASEKVTLACPHCGVEHEEKKKLHFNLKGRWLRQGEYLDKNGQVHGEPRITRYASFWQKGPTATFQTWNELVYKYKAALIEYERTGSIQSLKTTINTDQGKPFTPPRTMSCTAGDLADRASNYGLKVVPEWVRFLTAAIDIQAGKRSGFEVQVIGWGVDLEHIVLDRFAINKSNRLDDDGKRLQVAPGSYVEDWELITEKVLKRTYPLEDDSGRHMAILKVACDSGGEAGVTTKAYEYYRNLRKQKLHRRFMLVKGASQFNATLIRLTYPSPSKQKIKRGKKINMRGDIPLYMLNTHQIKDGVINDLLREFPGPRFVHFPDWLPESFYDELTYEVRDSAGRWEKPGNGANEAFDLMVYNWAIIYSRKLENMNWENPLPFALPWDQNPLVFNPN
ncbi:phage terminase large subunit family protein [Spartinivicinus poritis]|uniref:Phage terminase large subunit family protein n=1 Tax=Spartinivicinus poritis TaxID=2994640 RepID=A0ABT5UG00_9GAMM|nr:terminase gpA endonuclease subunit [Spartinivicinus sp. A2-2]MDE1465307.1 phage terminase large subunit family protein [Spartinivicinus sp. A2-2]